MTPQVPSALAHLGLFLRGYRNVGSKRTNIEAIDAINRSTAYNSMFPSIVVSAHWPHRFNSGSDIPIVSSSLSRLTCGYKLAVVYP